MGLKERLAELREEGLQEIRESEDLKKINQVRVKMLGKKGPITNVLRGMRDLSAEERPKVGQFANKVRDELTAAIESKAKRIGVIATESTTKDGAYVRELQKLDPHVKVISKATQPLVAIVEHGKTGTVEAQKTVDQQLASFDQEPVDALILGCTHFPFLTHEINQKMGNKVRLIDPALETVNQVKKLLTTEHRLAQQAASYQLYSTGDRNDLIAGADKWLHGQYDSCNNLNLEGDN